MRKFVLTMAALAAMLAGGVSFISSAEAMPAASGIAAAVAGDGLLQKAAYTCRPVWRCGRYGCGWRRVCYWAPRAYYGRPHYWGPRRYYRHHRRW
jgi:hypothetical protein